MQGLFHDILIGGGGSRVKLKVRLISFQFWAQKNKNLQDMKKVLNDQYKQNLMNYTHMQMQLLHAGVVS